MYKREKHYNEMISKADLEIEISKTLQERAWTGYTVDE